MQYKILIIALLILIISWYYFQSSEIPMVYMPLKNEFLTPPPAADPYILLYEGYNFKNLAYRFAPGNINHNNDNIGRGYIRQILKCDLKSLDINLPKMDSEFDKIRHVEIWAVDQKDNSTASSETG